MEKGKGPLKIKGLKKAMALDEAMDKKLGIKQGSKRDLKIDKAKGIDKFEYGKAKGPKTDKKNDFKF